MNAIILRNFHIRYKQNIQKKAKGVKRCVVKRRLMFENYKDLLFKNKNNNAITTKI